MAVDNNLLMEERVEEDTTKDRYLTFEIDEEEYGIDIANINEIIQIKDIAPLPETPPYVEGIINLRGDIIPVISVRKRFLKPVKPYDELTCIVVIEFESYTLGLVVDSIKAVVVIDESKVAPPPSAKLSHHNKYIRSIGREGDKVKLLMDLDKFLFQD